MLVISIFSFSHNVFEGLLSQGRQDCVIKDCLFVLSSDKHEILVTSSDQHFQLFCYVFQSLFFQGRKRFNALPSGKILDWPKLKAIADKKINVAEMMISLSDRVENIVGKGENAGYQHFLFFPLRFQKPTFSGWLRIGVVWYRVNIGSFCK